jgi:NADPH:quinone reductase-like Zn-dependent oxidoreductase
MAVAPVPEAALADPVALASYIYVTDTAVPVPESGEVLIKVSRSTINPNDLYHLKGVYSATPDMPFPRPLGFEGAGVVVASGGCVIGRFRLGKRVAFYAMGMFGEYVVCNALDVLDIPDDVDFSTAACSVANPMTALAMLKVAKTSGSNVIINTAAASALGRLLIRLGKKNGIDLICVVRRADQIPICRAEGATHVLNSSAPDFDDQLKQVVQATGCRLAFDCVAGDMPERLLNALPDIGGAVKLYGYMTPGPITLTPQTLFAGRRLETFEINAYLSRVSLLAKGILAQRIARGMGKDFKSEVQKTFPLSAGVEALSYYSRNMTAGKVQIVADEQL